LNLNLGSVHILRNALNGGWEVCARVTKRFEQMGICTVLRYEGGKKPEYSGT
jgi:hypothetical protein